MEYIFDELETTLGENYEGISIPELRTEWETQWERFKRNIDLLTD